MGPSIPIALLGYGTVGSAVDRLLRERTDDIARVAGQPVEVRRALVRDLARERGAPPGVLTDDVAAIRDDPDVRVVAEVMGGVEPTRAYLLQLFEAGKSVVSANKQLLARHGEELFAAAERHGVQLRFEASVCAAIPVVKVLRESMIASDVDGVLGIVNGTTNYILTAMDQGQDYASALARAQELGYAEADPTEDVNGADAAAKIAILASIAFHTRVTIDDVPHSGIDALEPLDVAHAAELGYRIKLIAEARRTEQGVVARVHPTLVPPLAPAGRRRRRVQRRDAARPGDPRDHAGRPRRGRRRDGVGGGRRPHGHPRHVRARASSSTTATTAGCRWCRRRRSSPRCSCAWTSTTARACWPRSRASWPSRPSPSTPCSRRPPPGAPTS